MIDLQDQFCGIMWHQQKLQLQVSSRLYIQSRNNAFASKLFIFYLRRRGGYMGGSGGRTPKKNVVPSAPILA